MLLVIFIWKLKYLFYLISKVFFRLISCFIKIFFVTASIVKSYYAQKYFYKLFTMKNCRKPDLCILWTFQNHRPWIILNTCHSQLEEFHMCFFGQHFTPHSLPAQLVQQTAHVSSWTPSSQRCFSSVSCNLFYIHQEALLSKVIWT